MQFIFIEDIFITLDFYQRTHLELERVISLKTSSADGALLVVTTLTSETTIRNNIEITFFIIAAWQIV